jgi:hypothetical protein
LTHLLADGGPVHISYKNYDWSINSWIIVVVVLHWIYRMCIVHISGFVYFLMCWNIGEYCSDMKLYQNRKYKFYFYSAHFWYSIMVHTLKCKFFILLFWLWLDIQKTFF